MHLRIQLGASCHPGILLRVSFKAKSGSCLGSNVNGTIAVARIFAVHVIGAKQFHKFVLLMV
jgi:hypothetical protein